MPAVKSFPGIVTCLACGLAAASIASAQPTGFDGHKVVRIDVTTDAELATLQELAAMGRDFEIWSEVTRVGVNEARVSPAALAALEASGLCYEVTVEDLQKDLDERFGVGRGGEFFDYLRTYDEHVEFLARLVEEYPDLVEVEMIGQSVEGRPLWLLRITGPGSGSDKPGVLYHGAQHGNESAGASVIAYLADYLLSNYDTDPNVAAMVDGVEWYLVPISNPDGYEAYRRENANNVDLNRNWDGPGAGGHSYCGPFPFSEPETAALRDLLISHPSIHLHLDVHGYIDWFIWPWGHRLDLTPEHGTYDAIGQRAHSIILANGGPNYSIGTVRDVAYPVYGGSTNYTYGDLGLWGLTFELDDSVPDAYQYSLPVMLMLGHWAFDCNENGIPDIDELAAGGPDCNLNNTLDECEADCDADGVPDMCEIAAGAADCNYNAIPDDCDIDSGNSEDCNLDGVPDECELDCNRNGVLDECEIGEGLAADCSGNGIPDACEPDCDGNGIADSCDILAGDLSDCDADGVPDECELSGRRLDLERTLKLLDLRHLRITQVVPDCFAFTEGESGDEIVDGGQHMYDYGNRLITDSAKRIPYSNRNTTAGDARFGVGSSYFTAKYPGLFVAAMESLNIESIRTDGWYGSRGAAEAEGKASRHEHRGFQYTVFTRRSFGASSPSVNHLFIAPGINLGLTHSTYENHENRDQHRLSGLQDVRDLVYVLVGSENGRYLEYAELLDIADEVLNNLAFVELDCNGNGIPDACDIAAGASQDVNANGVPDECECLGDLDRDGQVGLSDLAILLSNYSVSSGMLYELGDMIGDGAIDLADLAALIGAYGQPCP